MTKYLVKVILKRKGLFWLTVSGGKDVKGRTVVTMMAGE